jgi:hypothetical protein
MTENYGCYYCASPHFVTGKTVKADGSLQYWRRCTHCGKNWMGEGKFLKADTLYGKESMPIFEDYRQADARCGFRNCSEKAQEHHYLPRNIADKNGVTAEDWPTGPLCHRHHVLWHWYVEGLKLDEPLLRGLGRI